ncbi:MAG: right-handed parallel beta-helix repeat-containing protein, partial [Abitibacteriaceae bacterium]|nr:right-handed parallel beta-helix repeat-containing protein [Abditibacteriaceae bacterium]
GIVISGGAHNNLIGGTTAATRNVLSGNKNDGIHIIDQGSDNNVVQGNYIGADASGVHALPNQQSGIGILDGVHRSVIGGVVSGARNIISGNTNNGIFIGGISAASNLVQGNYLGLGADGATILPSSPLSNGVAIVGGASGNLVGGLMPGARNILGGNNGSGVVIASSNTKANVVQGNYIGTDVTGTRIKLNGNGVAITNGAQGNLVGGTTPAARNIISGNGSGFWIKDVNTSMNQVQGNYIGLNAAGTLAVPNTQGVLIASGASFNTIGGTAAGMRNIISGNLIDGVHIVDKGTSDNVVQGNYIGTNLSGTAALANKGAGVTIANQAQHNTVGGTVAAARNILSGNTQGVFLVDKGTDSNIIQGNYLGTDVTGNKALPNRDCGVAIWGGQHNLVGGSVTGARNVMSGNITDGIILAFDSTLNNQVQGNYIGLNAAGTSALPNRYFGVAIQGSSQNTIGGTTPEARNIISGNARAVLIVFAGTQGNAVQGNYIGLNPSGSATIPNGQGIVIWQGATNNIIGGTATGAGNVISGNRQDGILIIPNGPIGTDGNQVRGNTISHNSGSGVHVVGDSRGNSVRQNIIVANGKLGINLQPDGEPDNTVTPNDPGDADRGPNNLQNFPVITQVISNGSSTIINGTLNSTPNSRFDLDFYRNTALDASGYGEGEVYLGTTRTTTNNSGNGSFSVSVVGSFSRQFFTVTATNASTGDTSEFSKAIQASVTPRAVRVSTTISTASASVAQSSIQLSFSRLDSEVAANGEHYFVFINGHAVAVQSVAYNSARQRITLSLEEGSLTPGSEVVVRWQDLQDAQGHLVADGSQPLTAH